MSTESKRNHTDTSSSRQFALRRSMDSRPEHHGVPVYEVIAQDNINDIHLENSINSKNVPSVKMQRLNNQIPASLVKTVENGLAPDELALISASAGIASSTMIMSTGDEDDEHDIEGGELEETELSLIEKDEVDQMERIIQEDSMQVDSERNDETSSNKMETSNISSNSATSTSNTIYEILLPSKMTREMKNFLKVSEKEIPSKDSGNDSDSTVIITDEIGKKRRKSMSRSRSRNRTSIRSKSVSSRSRKTVNEMLNDEGGDNANAEDLAGDEEDSIGEVPYIAKLIENRAPSAPPKVGWDSFCFKCHTDTAVLSLTCKKCKCSYHRHCARLLSTPIPKVPDDFICIDCIEIDKANKSTVNKYNHPKIEQHMLKQMLTTILEKIRTYPDRDFFENDVQFKSSIKENNQPLIITQMSLKRIEERINSTYYKVSEAFLHDIKQLEHNWTIVDRNKLKSLKLILKFVNTEINEMEACVHCFSNSFVVSNWFTAPCKRPHLLIWAKLKGYPYWPAKVMSLDSTKENADVRFFGAHDRAWVPVSHCLIFSDKDPNKTGKATTPTNNKSKSQKGIADAIKEKDEYIKNMREMYGFRYSFTREILDPDNLQTQLENQLPGLKKDNLTIDDKNQKEKLTLKIIKTSDGTQTIEKTPKINDKDRHPLYRVLSRNEENNEKNEQSRVVKAIILKRNTDNDKEKRLSRNNSLSETSESNFSSVSTASLRRKSIKEVDKRRKSFRKETRSVTPEPDKKRPKTDANTNNTNTANTVVPHQESNKEVSTNKQNIPEGTNEIRQSKEKSTRTVQRSQSFNRSQDKNKKDKTRRLSTLSTPSILNHDSTIKIAPLKPISPQKSTSNLTNKSVSGTSTPVSITSNKNSSKRPSTNLEYNPDVIIKDEPLSDNEEVVQRDQVTINDLAELVNENSRSSTPAKRKNKTIIISTSDNSNDSFQNQISRARKSFPKPIPANLTPDSIRQSQIRTTTAMVYIPQVFSTTSNESSPLSNIQNSSNINLSDSVMHVQTSNQSQTQIMNGNEHVNNFPSSSQSELTHNSRMQNRLPSTNSDVSSLPKLVPKPSGVFTSEGNTFQRESGDVAALFSQNAHRMTDYFKSLLVDTIGAISNGVSDAQNVVLKLENEKLKQQINTLKTENAQKFEKLRKDHMIELTNLKTTYEEKIKSINNAHTEDKVRLIKEIRQQCEIEKQRAIETTRRETKKMTWCSNCNKEARFYCCWNTSYCGPLCQKNHWQQHMKYCTNRNSNNTSEQNASNNKQQVQHHHHQQQPQQQQQHHHIESINVAANVANKAITPPIASSIANLAVNNNNRQMLQQITLSKQPSQISNLPQPPTSHSSNATLSQLENQLLRGTKPQTIITTSRGQQIIQTVLPHIPQQYIIQQQKLPTANSTIPIPPLISTGQNPSNLIVQTVERNNSPQMTVISTTANPNISEIIASQHSGIINVPSSSPATKILNHTVISSNGK
ncbi:hypothetical protein PVAND_010256 [Polypedilum vanderplanki]|uniref:Uncharacterized protein n=1 Tax=Polypedilum vanderplanki TaxID=319348 RepID=A0A9J6CF09_POLVA|nr:hypothetical protein PVAND_010256 [Polypedilum vanderplanki]